ncbi:glycosyltransferase family 2 protein [Halorubrum coriense]|nr:glycosyltransferase family 2 protein [Halorubrum coriense]
MTQETSSIEQQAKHRPAVGLVAVDDPTVLENVIAAQQRGLDVVMADTLEGTSAVVRAARDLGVDVFEPPAQGVPEEDLKHHLWVRGSARTDAGMIIAPDSTRRIDYQASLEAHTHSERTSTIPVDQGDELGILVGIPAYNEATTIADVVSEAHKYADDVLVVDDASQDATASVARGAGATVVEHSKNQGYGGALKTVFEEADIRGANHLTILDGDGQHDPADIPEAVRIQEETDADIVIGSRFVEGSDTDLPVYRRFGLAVVNTLTNFSMGILRSESWVKDTQSGFRTYNGDAIATLSADGTIGEGMSASTDILYHAHEQNYDLEEIGTTIDYDVEDPSSHNPVSHGLTLVSNILKTVERERPVTTLGVPGFLSAFVGLGLGYWTFSNYISTGTFPLGLAVTSGFFGLAGIFSCFTAIILHSLNQHLDTQPVE